MADNELEIILVLQDKVTKEFDAIKNKIVKGNKEIASGSEDAGKGVLQGFRSQTQGLNLLRTTVARVGIFWSITFGTMIKGVLDLGKEIDNLDRQAIKLGISSAELSKRMYGFDITTESARVGVASVRNAFTDFNNALELTKLKIAETAGEAAILNQQYNIMGKLANMAAGQSMFTAGKGVSRETAKGNILGKAEQNRANSPEGIAANETATDMYNKLTMSKTELQAEQFKKQIEMLHLYQADTSQLEQAFAQSQLETEILTKAQLNADRLALEGDYIGATRINNEIQIANFRKTTDDKVLIATFAANKEIELSNKVRQAKLQEFQMIANGLSGLAAAAQGYAAENKKQAKTAAAIQLASTIVNTASAVMSGLATPPMIPVGLGLGAMAAATGALQIATISGQAFASGGRPPVGEASLVGERGTEMFVPDSAGTIIPNNRLGGSRITTISIEINNPTVRSDEDIDKLTEEVSMRLSREVERV